MTWHGITLHGIAVVALHRIASHCITARFSKLRLFFCIAVEAPEPELPKPALVGMPIPSATGQLV